MCGYRENLASLVFHHAASSDKDFKLDMRSMSNRRLETVRAEVDKCILLCANCHAGFTSLTILFNPNSPYIKIIESNIIVKCPTISFT